MLEWDPPRVFAFAWGEDVLRFELAEDGDGTALVFTHAFAHQPGKPARDGAGWATCLAVALDDQLAEARQVGLVVGAPVVTRACAAAELPVERVEAGRPPGPVAGRLAGLVGERVGEHQRGPSPSSASSKRSTSSPQAKAKTRGGSHSSTSPGHTSRPCSPPKSNCIGAPTRGS